ncbi:MAG: EAL domain-containing protein [Steroidobacterales bacterium]
MSEPRTPDKSAPPEVAASERTVTAAQLGSRLLRVLSPLRVKSLSLHDATGELLWLNQGEFGSVQRRCLQEALAAFSLDATLTHLERDLEEGRRALFLCSQTTLGERSSLAFAIVSSRRRPDIDLQTLMARVFATMRRFSTAPALQLPIAAMHGARATQAPPAAAAEQPAPTAAAAAPASQPHPPLRSRLYARLRPGGTTRRYEIAAGTVRSCERDLERADRLIHLLKRRGARDAPAPASFTLPVCAESVLGTEFLAQLAPTLEQAGLAEGILGFCVPAAAWDTDLTAAERFIERCGEQRCFVALDDFSLELCGFKLLRMNAVRCLKLDAALTADGLSNKFAHANIAAIVKAARVLGLYCVAKGVQSSATARWLASAGIEFAQGASRGTGAATTRRARVLKLAMGS